MVFMVAAAFAPRALVGWLVDWLVGRGRVRGRGREVRVRERGRVGG